MFRKRRQPAPHFKIPIAPYNPTTGEHAGLGTIPGKGTTLAMFQVVEEDTHDNYVVCRGYEADNDPRFEFLHDPYSFPDTTPINVAKPYGARGTFPYVEGQIIVAARIKGKLGYNPGKAETTVGQPADLDEATVLLKDDADVAISWMDVALPEPPEQGMFWYIAGGVQNGFTAVEAGINMGINTGKITGLTPDPGVAPTGEKLFVATKAVRLWFTFNGYFRKDVSVAGHALCTVYLKRYDSLNVLKETWSNFCDVPTLSSFTAGMQCCAQGKFVMEEDDYVVASAVFAGAYTGTMGLHGACLYVRPIRNS